jgi:hypothetical protein
MKYDLDDIPEIQNGTNRPTSRFFPEIVPQADGLHFVTGDYDQEHHGEAVVLYDGERRIAGGFVYLPNKTSEADPTKIRKQVFMQQWLDEYAATQGRGE